MATCEGRDVPEVRTANILIKPLELFKNARKCIHIYLKASCHEKYNWSIGNI